MQLTDVIMNELNSMPTFEDKNKYLTSGFIEGATISAPVSDVVDALGLREQINTTMMQTMIQEKGNPESNQYMFSKDYSNEVILNTLKNIYEKSVMQDEELFGKDVVEGVKQHRIKQEALEDDIDIVNKRILNLQNVISSERKSFDERSTIVGWDKDNPLYKVDQILSPFLPAAQALTLGFVNPKTVSKVTGWDEDETAIPFFSAAIPALTKLAMQVPAGMFDYVYGDGMEKIENRKLNWDPVNKRIGPGNTIGATQDRLSEAYAERDSLKAILAPLNKIEEEGDDIVRFREEQRGILSNANITPLIENKYTTLPELIQLLEENK
tara:strand:- start:2272 stop:3246 length:975 start_codon:yes stop_codon:yes gene_type:complete